MFPPLLLLFPAVCTPLHTHKGLMTTRSNSRILQFGIWSSRGAWRNQASFERRRRLCAFLVLTLGHLAERMFDAGGRGGGNGMSTSSSCLFSFFFGGGALLCPDRSSFCTTFALLLADYLFLVIYIRIVSSLFRKYGYVALSSRW